MGNRIDFELFEYIDDLDQELDDTHSISDNINTEWVNGLLACFEFVDNIVDNTCYNKE